MDFSKLCKPALIYCIFSVVFLIYDNLLLGFSITSIIFRTIFITLWTLLLNFLCTSGYSVVSWILVLFPMIFLFL